MTSTIVNIIVNSRLGVTTILGDKYNLSTTKQFYRASIFSKILIFFFRIKHRGITRGVGGIFFDDLDAPDRESCFNFVKDCAESVIPGELKFIHTR